ncbi:DUF6153 family protein [Actinomadura sp. 6N118]|uniref:DUF6153 family protein n=1 Tax=Actinomadura sp. 6N118 TaxID=3375151 RepID=UPI0037BD5093
MQGAPVQNRTARAGARSRPPEVHAQLPTSVVSPQRECHSGAPPLREGRLGVSWTALLGLLLVSCVMAMHGLQASSSPVDASGVPGISAEHGLVGHADSGHADASYGGSGHGGSHSNGSHDPEHHSGGEICLALLTLVSFVVLLLAAWRTWRPAFLVPRSTVRPRPRDAGRSPPPLAFRSAVLRL